MDYSLLVGMLPPAASELCARRESSLHAPDAARSPADQEADPLRASQQTPCAPRRSAYGLHTAKHEWRLAGGGRCTLGIIDVLVRYSLWKRLEHLVLGTLRGGRNISCQPPHVYARRLGDFVATAVTASQTDRAAAADVEAV
jgi:hypothetical protein